MTIVDHHHHSRRTTCTSNNVTTVERGNSYSESVVSNHSDSDSYDDGKAIAKGGVAVPFPWKVHNMLDCVQKDGLESIVSWQSHGRSFTVHKPTIFVEQIMPRYVWTDITRIIVFFSLTYPIINAVDLRCFRFFSQTKYASFQRQLNLYGFARFAHGQDKGAYFHHNFVRGKRSLVRGMVRRKIKGTKIRRPLLPSEEPDFYSAEWQDENRVGDDMPNGKSSSTISRQEAAFVSPQISPPISPRHLVQQPMQPPPSQLQYSSISYMQMSSLEPLTMEETLESVEEQLYDNVDLLFFEGAPFYTLDDPDEQDAFYVDPLPVGGSNATL
jgi:hypothetical protein